MDRHLEVPYIKQISEMTCFSACVEMVLRFYGSSINQKELYEKAKWGEGEGLGSTDAGASLVIKDLGFKMIHWENEGKNPSEKWKDLVERYYKKQVEETTKLGAFEMRRDATLGIIKKFLSKEVPVIAEVDTGKLREVDKTGWTHAIVLVGFDDANLIYHDPSTKHGGESKKISFERFEDCWISRHIERSMSIITKLDK